MSASFIIIALLMILVANVHGDPSARVFSNSSCTAKIDDPIVNRAIIATQTTSCQVANQDDSFTIACQKPNATATALYIAYYNDDKLCSRTPPSAVYSVVGNTQPLICAPGTLSVEEDGGDIKTTTLYFTVDCTSDNTNDDAATEERILGAALGGGIIIFVLLVCLLWFCRDRKVTPPNNNLVLMSTSPLINGGDDESKSIAMTDHITEHVDNDTTQVAARIPIATPTRQRLSYGTLD